MITLDCVRLIEPPAPVASRDWLPANVTMPKGTETGGLPFSLSAFPHVDGVVDAFDDPAVRRIILQWGTRLGKTTTVLSLFAETAATNPRNMMLASPTKEASGRVVTSRLYPILECTSGVAEQLPPPSRRSMFHVKLRDCRIYVGWSGSETSLADVGAYFGLANEIDKWDESAGTEADSLALFVNRFKGFPNHKIMMESTPTIKGRSRIESELNKSRRHLRYCQCPHCGHYQPLAKGDEQSPGGIKWERLENGQSDPQKAFETAYYECRNCQGRIENHHRTQLLRSGIWVPDGCGVTECGKLTGEPLVKSKESMGFGPLPSWYALTETWGHFPRVFLNAKKPRDLQDVVNSYMAETFERKKSKTTAQKLAERIVDASLNRRTVPEWARFLTVPVDRQKADGGFVVWGVLAHGTEDRTALIDWGMAITLDEIWETVFRGTYGFEDGQTMMPAAGAIDSGWDPKTTYDFCLSHPGLLAVKGASTDLGGKPYKLVDMEAHGITLMHVATDFWETELQNRLDSRHANEPGSLTLPREAATDIELLEQLLNAELSDRTDSRGETKVLWKKKHDSLPNDLRDIVRYGMCLAHAWLIENHDGSLPQRNASEQKQQPQFQGGETRPDGRPFIE